MSREPFAERVLQTNCVVTNALCIASPLFVFCTNYYEYTPSPPHASFFEKRFWDTLKREWGPAAEMPLLRGRPQGDGYNSMLNVPRFLSLLRHSLFLVRYSIFKCFTPTPLRVCRSHLPRPNDWCRCRASLSRGDWFPRVGTHSTNYCSSRCCKCVRWCRSNAECSEHWKHQRRSWRWSGMYA